MKEDTESHIIPKVKVKETVDIKHFHKLNQPEKVWKIFLARGTLEKNANLNLTTFFIMF